MNKVTAAPARREETQVGDTLIYTPSFEALMNGEDPRHAEFCQEHNGMTAEVLAFAEDSISEFLGVAAEMAGIDRLAPAMTDVYVKFENGDRPDFPIALAFFRHP